MPAPAYESATSITSLHVAQQIEVRKALDLKIQIEKEKRRRLETEKGQKSVAIQPNHLAFVSAYPLRQYIYETFRIIEPGKEFKNNWHIDAMSEVLESATTGEIKKLLINVPRRHMKSTAFSVMWPTWAWTFLPSSKWLYASFNEKFAYRDSELCMKIIQSAYYQERFSSVFQPSLHTWRKSKLENTKGGVRECFGVGKGTGSGGDFVLTDDPHQIDEAESEKITEKTVRWYFETYYNNVNDPDTAVRAIIHQRVGEKDLTGEILARELDYVHLCLPARFEEDHPHRNSVSKPLKLGKVSQFDHNQNPDLKTGDEKLWVDPRAKEAKTFKNPWYRNWYKTVYRSQGLQSSGEGELLWPQHYSEAHIKEMVKHIAAYGESSQLQQRPIRRGGNFFNSLNFTKHLVLPTALEYNGMSYCRYFDKAGTSGGGDWTVGMLIARTQKRPYTLYIIDVFRKQIGLYERMDEMLRLAEEDTRNYVDNRIDTEYTIGIERELASSGKDVATIEKDHLLGYNVVIDVPKGKKAHRANIPKNISEGGRLRLVKGDWNDVFLRELEKFDPTKEHQVDDQIDALSGGTKLLVFGQRQQGSSFSGVY